jgi:arylsulfatase A-like enzyme
MWWPGTIPSGKTCSELCTAMDLLPTFAGLAGIDLASVYPDNRVIDGHDISRLLRNDHGAKTPYEAFLYYHSFGGVDAIRSGDWKYHLGRKALYNLKDDISEQDNLVDKYPELVKQLSDKANLMKREVEANSRPVGLYDQQNWGETSLSPDGYVRADAAHGNKVRPSRHVRFETNGSVSGEIYDIHGRKVRGARRTAKSPEVKPGRGVYITANPD